MRTTSLLLAMLLSGCVAESMDDGTRDNRGGGGKGDGPSDDPGAQLVASWRVHAIDSQVAAACPQGFDTVALYSQPIDASGNADGSVLIDLFDCSAGEDATAALEPGRYKVWLEITDHNNTTSYAASPSTIVDLDTDDRSIAFDILSDGGYFSLSWSLIGATSNHALQCSDVAGLDGIETIATDVASPTSAISDRFDCADGFGVTSGFRAGTYSVSVDAFNAQDAALGAAPALASKTIEAPNKVTNLGHVTIPVDGL